MIYCSFIFDLTNILPFSFTSRFQLTLLKVFFFLRIYLKIERMLILLSVVGNLILCQVIFITEKAIQVP